MNEQKTNTYPEVEIILLAAGAGRRMPGKDKMLLPVFGTSMLRHLACEAIHSSAGRVTVVLPSEKGRRASARRRALGDTDLNICHYEGAEEGMSGPLQAGIASLRADVQAAVILLADMPFVKRADINALIRGYRNSDKQRICRMKTRNGRAGHPILFPTRFFPELAKVKGDQGGRRILREQGENIIDVNASSDRILVDIDSPSDWERWKGDLLSP